MAKSTRQTFNPGDVVYIATKKPKTTQWSGFDPGAWTKGIVLNSGASSYLIKASGGVRVLQLTRGYFLSPLFGRTRFETAVYRNRRDTLRTEESFLVEIKPALDERDQARQALADSKLVNQRARAVEIAQRIGEAFYSDGGEGNLIQLAADILFIEATKPPAPWNILINTDPLKEEEDLG